MVSPGDQSRCESSDEMDFVDGCSDRSTTETRRCSRGVGKSD